MTIRNVRPGLRILGAVTFLSACHALLVAPHSTAHAQDDDPVLAWVGDHAIKTSDVKAVSQRAIGQQEWTAEARKQLDRRTLEQLVKRQLAIQYIRAQKLNATDSDIQLEIRKLETQLAQRDEKLDSYLKNKNRTLEQLHEEISWRIGWDRFLKKYMTDANLKRYFEKHTREFDGTQLKVAHILLKVPDEGDDAQPQIKQAAKIREQITQGETTFAAAAAKFSQSATAAQGGDLGWISRHQPMPESFSQAAYGLKKGDVSEPVRSPYGVHLILCTDVKSGTKSYDEVESVVRRAASQYLFDWAADQKRDEVKVRYVK